MEALKILLGRGEFIFMGGGGAGKMPFLGTIIRGWGGRVVYLFDNDHGMKNGRKNLKSNWKIDDAQIMSIMPDKGSLEDIFEKADFINFVLNLPIVKYSLGNSDYVKEKQLNKVLLARGFLKRVKSNGVKLTKPTMDRVNKLFDKLQKTMNPED